MRVGIANSSKANLKTSLPKELTILNQQKLLQMAERGMASMTNDERQRMQRDIAKDAVELGQF